MPRSLPFVYAAEELADALTERLAPALAAAELTATQFNVLYMLIEDGPMRMSELAEHQRCVKSNVSYITRTMLREGLVELTASEEDARARVPRRRRRARRDVIATVDAADRRGYVLVQQLNQSSQGDRA